MKNGTVALVVAVEDSAPKLIEMLSDDKEIALFEKGIKSGEADPLLAVYDLRAQQEKEDDEFGDYVESLLTQPFTRLDIQDHGVRWFRSKIKIEEFQKTESQAREVIANFAYQLYLEDQARTDFVLAGPTAQVRVRVFTLSPEKAQAPQSQAA